MELLTRLEERRIYTVFKNFKKRFDNKMITEHYFYGTLKLQNIQLALKSDILDLRPRENAVSGLFFNHS